MWAEIFLHRRDCTPLHKREASSGQKDNVQVNVDRVSVWLPKASGLRNLTRWMERSQMIVFHKRVFSQIMSAWVLGRARVNIFQLISTCIWSLKPNLDVLEENWKRNSHRCQFRHHDSSHWNWHWVGELVFVDLIQNTWNLFFIWHHFHQQVDNSWPHGWTRPWWTERCLHHSHHLF